MCSSDLEEEGAESGDGEEDAGPSILFCLSSMPSLKPCISVALSWSFAPAVTCIPCATNKLSVTKKGVMGGSCLFVGKILER